MSMALPTRGSLADTSFAELIAALMTLKATGKLEVSKGQVKRVLFFDGGRVVSVTSNALSDSFGRILESARRLDAEAAARVRREAHAAQISQEEWVQREGLLTDAELERFLKLQARVRLTSVLGWTDGTYRFLPLDQVKEAPGFDGLDVPRIALQAIRRRADTPHVRMGVISRTSEAPRLATAPPYPLETLGLSPEELGFVRRFDGTKTLGELLMSPGIDPAEAMVLSYTLVVTGMVFVGKEAQVAPRRAPARAGGAPPRREAAPRPSSMAVPPPSAVAVPPPSAVAVPPPSAVAVPPPSAMAVPPPSAMAVPPPSSRPAVAVPPPSAVAVPPPSSRPAAVVPAPSAVAVPPPSSRPAVAVPPPSAVAVPPPSSRPAVAVPPPASRPAAAVPPPSSRPAAPTSPAVAVPSAAAESPPSSRSVETPAAAQVPSPAAAVPPPAAVMAPAPPAADAAQIAPAADPPAPPAQRQADSAVLAPPAAVVVPPPGSADAALASEGGGLDFIDAMIAEEVGEFTGPVPVVRKQAEHNPILNFSMAGFSDEELALSKRFREDYLRMKKQHHFELLGVERHANSADIRKAYFKMVNDYHPDRLVGKPPSVQELGTELFNTIQHAYDTLTDPERREKYVAKVFYGKETEEEEAAVATVQRVLKADAHYKQGIGLLNAGDIRGAHRGFEQAVEIYPQEPEYRACLGYATFLLNHPRNEDAWQAAEAMVQEALKENPKLDRGNYYMGQIALTRGKPTLARKYFVRALKSNPKNMDAMKAYQKVKSEQPKADEDKGMLSSLFSVFKK